MASAGRTQEDQLRVQRRARARREAIALFIVAIGLFVGAILLRASAVRREEATMPPAEPHSAATRPANPAETANPRDRLAAQATAQGALPATMPRTRAGKLRALRRAGIEPSRGPDGKPRIDAAPVIDALNAAGVRDGIAAFPKPGTDPPKEGVIVPDDWELPEGYVRHHQSTDDGEPLPPILMFHPDYEFTDDAGNPVAIPADRVVPRELVPPGLPVEMLHVPARRG